MELQQYLGTTTQVTDKCYHHVQGLIRGFLKEGVHNEPVWYYLQGGAVTHPLNSMSKSGIEVMSGQDPRALFWISSCPRMHQLDVRRDHTHSQAIIAVF